MIDKKYDVIVMDPPWKYNARTNPYTRFRSGACGHYPLMSFEEIKKIPIDKISADNCALFIWCTFPFLEEQITLFNHWGFKYRTVGFTWLKTNPNNGQPFFGVGYYSKSNAEVCLLGVKGKMRPASNSVSSVIVAPRREHSRKPDEALEGIERLYPEANKLELFARRKRPGWDYCGWDLNGEDILMRLEAGEPAQALKETKLTPSRELTLSLFDFLDE